MVNLKLEFLKSSIKQLSIDTNSKIIFIGKSNAGKSSFINNLGNNKNLAYTSQTPGKTTVLNYYKLPKNNYLIDTPGYGYHAKSKAKFVEFDEMMHNLLTINTFQIKLIFLIFDIRRDLDKVDMEVINFLKSQDIFEKLYLVLTKIDKEGNNFINNKLKYFQNSLQISDKKIFYISNLKKTNIDKIQIFIKNTLKLD